MTADNFQCGVKAPDGTATYCDGANELCICSTRRCAIPDSSCPSKLKYRFAPEACVEPDDVRTRLASNSNQAFCPDMTSTPAACGVLSVEQTGFVACGTGQLCLCRAKSGPNALNVPDHRCVTKRSDICSGGTGLATTFDSTCIIGVRDQIDLILRAPSDPACPDAEVFPRTCGIPGGLNNKECGSTEACLCGLRSGASGELNVPTNTCVRADPMCSRDGGLGLMDRDFNCITGAVLENLVLRFDQQACPGYDIGGFKPDAGMDGGAP